MNHEMETVWLAALLEGEGCFFLFQQKYPMVQLSMTDLDVVERAASYAEGATNIRVQDRGIHKTAYIVAWNGDAAVALMHSVLPYMGQRRTGKINEILQAGAAHKSFMAGRRYDCDRCGTAFTPKASTAKYCSARCRADRNNATYKPVADKTCTECGQPFDHTKGGGAQLCSADCKRLHNNRYQRERRAASKG